MRSPNMMNWMISDCLEIVDLDVPRVLSGTCLLGRNAVGVAASWRWMCWESQLILCISVKQAGGEKRGRAAGPSRGLPEQAAKWRCAPLPDFWNASGHRHGHHVQRGCYPAAKDCLCFLDDRNKFSGYICCSCLSVGNLRHQMQTTIVKQSLVRKSWCLRHLARLPPLLTAVSLASPLPFQPSNSRNISSLRGRYHCSCC